MKYFIRAVIVALLLNVSALAARAVEATWNYAVQVTASVQASPARITLNWTQDTTSTPSSHTVYRKAVGATSWGSGTTLPGTTLTYTDSAVTVGTAYEYQVVRAAGGYSAYGYIQSGIDVSLVENRGKVVLVVDKTHAAALAPELTRLQDDLRGDGWLVIRRDVARTDTPASVRSQIVSVYNSDPANVKAVFLFGHVPVPYSGLLNPDGHTDHRGAWPADVYYGDMNGAWTDSTVNYTQTQNSDPADAARLTNKPGDGKFDQTTLPSAVELEVGRVDLADMPGTTSWNSPPTFPGELELLRQYLNKDHKFRHRAVNVQRRAIVGDYFGIRNGEAFAASGYRNAAPLVGSDKITNLNVQHNDQRGVWIPALESGDYLFAYGTGAGSYRTISGLGNVGQYHDTNTVEFVSKDVHAVFNMLFGSWLGDWDHADSILRAPLATKTHGLAAMWSGRPHWFIHGMGLGGTIGSATRLTQNNTTLYRNQQNGSANLIHVALMGDPTLRLHPVAPPASLGGVAAGSTVTLTWAPSPETLLGYHVYRATSDTAPFTRLTSSVLSATTFVDYSAPAGATYMVRAIKREISPSGSYLNGSQGVFWKIGGATAPAPTSGDTTAPTVSLSAPAGGATVSGTAVTVSASASDNVGVASVQFQLNGANLGAADTAAPFSTAWNSTTVANGTHALRALARDAAGNSTPSTAVTVTVNNPTGGTTLLATPSASDAWVDDALPAGAIGTASGGDTWNWVTSGPAPYSGTKAHQSALATGLHEHSFNWATPMAVATGDVLYAYIYLDPASPPSEIMISWCADNWEHRAYWGANSINYGKDGTVSRRRVGNLPAAGQWVRLEVPASQVGLEGKNVKGMSFALFGGKATWDASGRAPAGSTTPPPATDSGTATVTVAATDANAVIGTTDHATFTLTRTGSTAAALKVKFALSGTAVKWIDYRRPEGDMPVEMTIPAGAASVAMNLKALLNSTNVNPQTVIITVSADAAYAVGTQKSATATITATAQTPPPTSGDGTPPPPATGDLAIWFDDALPAGATGYGSGGDTWNWVTGSPAPFSGTKAHPSALASGLHEHSFNWAHVPMAVENGDVLVAHIYLDPANPPSEIMISWCADNWEHRAYWGANLINRGKDGTVSRRRVGDLPAAGQWVRLEVPASAVGLEGKKVKGMSFSLYGGKATWDASGRAPAGSTTPPPDSGTTTVTVAATDANAVIGTSDHATFTVTRTGGTAAALKVKFALSGTAVKWIDYRRPEGDMPVEMTIPAGVASVAMNLKALANSTSVNPQTVIVTVSADDLYSVGTQKAATATITADGESLSPTGPGSDTKAPTVAMSQPRLGATVSGTKVTVAASAYDNVGVAGIQFLLDGQNLGPEITTAPYVYIWDSTTTSNGRHFVGAIARDAAGNKSSALAGSVTVNNITSSPTGPDSPAPGGAPTVTLAATDGTAIINSTDHGTFSFTRTGSTDAALKVKFALSGTAVKWFDYRRPEGDMPVEMTIPAGAASVAMNLKALANSTNVSPQTIVVTMAADAPYTVGAAKTGTVTILAAGSTAPDPTGSTVDSTGGTGGVTSVTDPTGDTVGSDGSGSTGGGTGSSSDPTSIVAYTKLTIPTVGSNTLHILSPTTLELVRINTAPAGGAVDSWNFVDATGKFTAPANDQLTVTVNGQAVAVQSVGFKRRPLYAPLVPRDLRIINNLVLQLASPVAEGQTVEVKNADGKLWPSDMTFKTVAHAQRYSPAIHVNQEGYVPSLPKKASVGYYLGSLGEMVVPNLTFSLVDASTGRVAHQGTLVARPDKGWTYTPTPYQKVYEADFSSFATAGEYKLVVPGLGASLPFLVDDGIGMAFARTYAQGLYHQRCGHANELPYTRHTHAACHLAKASVPVSSSTFDFTWKTIAADANKTNANNPAQTAPKLTSPAAQLYPFVNQGPIDVSGGHHDAGDYSKYTINSATLLHNLMFSVDSIAGIAAFDNLGLPESGDGISDILQQARIEADFLAKLQDTDGGFYFLVYPENRRYESNVLPDRGDAQVVWPKTTAATAAAVAALAEAGSSPRFKAAYPQAAAAYLAKAKAGWKFLTDAIAKHGKAGAYQKITHYGDDFTHDDELAWAAAAMFAATGDAAIHATLVSWYNPSDPATRRWGWWHGYMGWGNAVRAYAFAARSGRLSAAQLDAGYLAKAEAEIRAAGDATLKWTQDSAYGTAFPDATKRQQSAGWYFSGTQAFDLVVARQLDTRTDYLDAIVRNLNYEGGSNAINLSYITGLGWKRQKEIVHQYAQNDERVLPPNGIPLGNLQTGPVYTGTYGTELAALTFPRDNAGTAPHGFYDRWSDTFNVATEFVHLDQARGLASYAYIASLTPAKSQAWKSAAATITGIPSTLSLDTPITAALQVAGLNLDGARILWEAKGQAPAYGETYTFTPGGYGSQWVEAEAQWPDGRRAVARATLFAENGLPTVNVAATDAIATIANATDTATWTFTRTGSTTSSITVGFKFSGTAAKWTDYRRPEGDMPAQVTIPAGATSATLTIKAIDNSTNADPHTVVLTLADGTGYNVGTPYSATVTIH